jgi:hypothetical protein
MLADGTWPHERQRNIIPILCIQVGELLKEENCGVDFDFPLLLANNHIAKPHMSGKFPDGDESFKLGDCDVWLDFGG